MDSIALKKMAAEVDASCGHHRWRFGDAVTTLMRQISLEYENQVGNILTTLYGRVLRKDCCSPSHDALLDYLISMQWVGWGDCEFGPPLDLAEDSEIYALSLIAYLGARLMDDAIDHHLDYKGRFQSFYGCQAKALGEPKAAEISSTAGHFLITASLRRMIKLGCPGAASAVMQLYNHVFAGALCETLSSNRPIDIGLYRSVVRHKAVAYDRILHIVFFRKAEPLVRDRILSFLASHSEASQWLNDLCDEVDDRSRNQMSMLNVSGMSREKIVDTVLNAFLELWRKSSDLHPDIRNAMAVRLNDSLKKLNRTDCGDLYFMDQHGR